MSLLKVSQIKNKLLKMFESHLNLSDISPLDKEREHKVLTRCLAALTVYLQSGCGEKEAAESVWDGSGDNGIDAAYFDTAESRVVFVQSKWISQGIGEPEAKDIGVFIKGLKDAIELNNSEFHPRLHGKISDIFLKLGMPGTFVHIVVASTGSSSLASPGQSLINGFLDELNGNDPDPIASAKTVGLSEIYSGLTNDPSAGNLALETTIIEWSSIATPHTAYFGIIDGLQLKYWWQKHGKGLVSRNIRHSLGSTEVNNQIKQTALIAPENFWYFNNGITLVAEEVEKAPSGAASHSHGHFLFKGASIVNGAQTVSTLGKVDNDESLGKVRVPIRIILLKGAPQGFGNEVTKTNNFQNRIDQRDFVAQDPEQSRLRQEMAVEGIDYQYVRSEDVSPTSNSCELIELTTALACASGDSNLVVQVKAGIGRIYADLDKAPYKALFNSSTSGARAFNAILVHRTIDNWIEKKKKTIVKKSGTVWGVLVHGNRILAACVFSKFNGSKLVQSIEAFSSSFKPNDAEALCEAAYSKMVAAIEKHYADKILASLFKNQSKSKVVYDNSIV